MKIRISPGNASAAAAEQPDGADSLARKTTAEVEIEVGQALPNVSVVDLVFEAGRATTVQEINDAIRAAATGRLKGILGYTDQPNVSSDFNHDPHSSVFHMDQTKVMDGTFVSILSWYDNEWGFSNRMADTAVAMGKLI